MFTYEDAVEEQERTHESERDFLKRHKPLFRTAIEYGNMFSHNDKWEYPITKRRADVTFAVGSGLINCVALNLYLGPEDSIIKDVGPIIEELKEHPYLKFKAESDYIENGWKGWDFSMETNPGTAQLKVRAFFESSNKCKKVGTGKFEEIMEIQCEE